MEAPGQKFYRLVSALDDLVAQEAANVAARDYAAVADIQSRANPLVAALASLGAGAADAMARARVASLLSRRQGNIELIDSQLATARAELQAVQESTGRVARIAPTYGRAGGFGGGSRFHAAG